MKSFKQYTEACWTGYTTKGMKKKGDRMVPNCVPVKEDGMAGGVANGVGGGAIAGIGVGKDGEPGVKKKKPIMMAIRRKTPQ